MGIFSRVSVFNRGEEGSDLSRCILYLVQVLTSTSMHLALFGFGILPIKTTTTGSHQLRNEPGCLHADHTISRDCCIQLLS